jgi:1,2-dihydroxy-3-keto-5-methylthiopentene dioxygenase
MARIIESNGQQRHDYAAITARLARLGITLRHWPAPESARTRALMDQAALDDIEKDELLAAVEHRFDELRREAGYQARDMVVIHPGIPNLSELLAKFEKIHTHSDDEVRYVLAGRGYFGFVEPEGAQFMLEVSEGDYINVPANTEHWFVMGDSPGIKAVRYFVDTSGWTPHYTDRARLFDSNGRTGSP